MEIKRGQIYIADLEPVRGAEKGKQRRVLIVSNDIGNELGPTVIAVPITGEVTAKRLKMPMFVRVFPSSKNGLIKESLIDCNQIRVLSKKDRIGDFLGEVDSNIIEKVDRALEVCLALKRCFKCNKVLMPHKKHCVSCGELQIKVCTHCMSEMDARYSYCPYCGNKKEVRISG
ncbi:type II toxin-antitoxin system PemK/MazF family toxin [Paenibacillus sp. BAC0078]